ncbi:MAG: hypothetical protein CW716_02610 [Candidatus Bathyarchaeum sp.]|nr:MAG: hypothetical protein CW716_02610 [Candidatus Bathyarchaeum sp.]
MPDGLLIFLSFLYLLLGFRLVRNPWWFFSKASPDVRFQKLVGYALLASGIILLIISFFA